METTTEKTIGQMVAHDYRTAAVFEAFGIDFCCKGNKTLDEVCRDKGIFKSLLLRDLKQVTAVPADSDRNYNDWPLDVLADHIEKKHHRYVEEKTTQLKQYLDKICTVHGKQHPELLRVRDLFLESAGDLASHMKKEELILFPFIRKMVRAEKEIMGFNKPPFGTIKNPISIMKDDHEHEGERFRQIAEITANYRPPANACNTYKVTYAMLQEFEENLHLHIHLENNILFPRAVEAEKEMYRS